MASLLGVRDRVSFEGQAAMELEWLASSAAPDGAYPFEVLAAPESQYPHVIDPRPLFAEACAEIRRGQDRAAIARRFHSTLVEIAASVCARLRSETGLDTVVCSGGVFQNALLAGEVAGRLRRDGFRAIRHRLVPPGDGGLCLGQLAIAAVELRREPRTTAP